MKDRVTLDTERYMAQEMADEAYYHAHKDEAYYEADDRVFEASDYLLEMIIDQWEQSPDDEELVHLTIQAGIDALHNRIDPSLTEKIDKLLISREWYQSAVEKERETLLSIPGRYEDW